MGSPPTWSILRALNDKFIRADDGWPVATSQEYSTHAIAHPATHAGHLKELRSNIRSTKPTASATTTHPVPALISRPSDLDDDTPEDERDLNQTVAYIFVREQGYHTDAKGPYSIPGHDGSTHDLVMVYGNYIHAEPMKGVAGAAQLAAYQRIQAYTDRHCKAPKPTYNRVDEAGNNPQVRAFFHQHDVRLDFVMPNIHRMNKAERAIQDWQAHRLSTLARKGSGFPADHWPRLNEGLRIIINHLRPSAFDKSIIGIGFMVNDTISTPIHSPHLLSKSRASIAIALPMATRAPSATSLVLTSHGTAHNGYSFATLLANGTIKQSINWLCTYRMTHDSLASVQCKK
jgi:hypothetical protein